MCLSIFLRIFFSVAGNLILHVVKNDMVPIDDFCQIKVVAMQFEIIWQKQVGYLHVFVKLNINAYLQAWRKLENSEGATWTERSEAASGREPGGGAKPRNWFRFSCLNGENLATVSIYLSKRSTDVRLKKQFTALIAVPQTYLPGRKTTCDSRSI